MEMMSKPKMDFGETELCLGLPGGGGGKKADDSSKNSINGNGKRGFSEIVDLKLNLSTKEPTMDLKEKMENNEKDDLVCNEDLVKPPAKVQVVGWPPVRNFRKNMVGGGRKSNAEENDDKKAVGGVLVKVSMDGAPYLRKVDLQMYKSYQDLSHALSKMFSLFTAGNYEAKGMINFMKENKLMDLLNSSDYVPSYEDKDGDWMLVGDVPWEMFVESCKRLRIMKGTEAAGLAPRAMEKCKNRN